MVLGEGQILSQIKKAYLLYSEKPDTNSLFNQLFQRAMAIGKKIRTETSITQGAMSISHVCLQHAQSQYTRNIQLNILILGAGEMAQLSYKLFSKHYTNSNYIFATRNKNNTPENITTINISEELSPELLSQQDIILACTSANDYIINSINYNNSPDKNIIIYDLSMPRNINPEINTQNNITLIDLDGINNIINTNKSLRESQAKKAEELLQEEINNLSHWCTYKQINDC